MKKIFYTSFVITLIILSIFLSKSMSKDSDLDSIIKEGKVVLMEPLETNLPMMEDQVLRVSPYKNTQYGYEIDFSKNFAINLPVAPYSDSVYITSLDDEKFKGIEIHGDNWENIIPIGIGVDVGQMYKDDLKTFAKKVWEVEGMDIDHKAIETVTELSESTFAGTKAYTFTSNKKSSLYVDGGFEIEKKFIIFEHLGKKMIMIYTSKDSGIEAIVKSFRFTN